MAFEYVDSQAVISIAAGADLSAKQYTFVKLSGTGVISAAAATDVVIGVLQNAPTSGKTAEVAITGVTKLKASAAISAGALVGTTSTGLAVAVVAGTDTTKYVLGQAITAAGAANDIITVAVNCVNINRAA
jgi:Kef-type K+ transport system membrane component KefB